MRKQIVIALVAAVTVAGGQALAADMPVYYPPIEIPAVDYGLAGSFYLRGSVGGNAWWAKDSTYRECDTGCTVSVGKDEVTEAGYGYSIGAGFGYETGDGLRADVTLDYLDNNDLKTRGGYSMRLRSTLALANIYYDFPLSSGHGSAAGGFGAYIGAGLGAAYNDVHSEGPDAGPDGRTYSPAAALMAGATYDMGSVVADLGYRMVYMPQVTNGDAALAAPALSSYYYNENFIHEVRGTLRYRFN